MSAKPVRDPLYQRSMNQTSTLIVDFASQFSLMQINWRLICKFNICANLLIEELVLNVKFLVGSHRPNQDSSLSNCTRKSLHRLTKQWIHNQKDQISSKELKKRSLISYKHQNFQIID